MGTEYNKEVGIRLYSKRKHLNLTRAELGEKIGLHESTIKRYEDGEIKSLDIEKIKEFATALETTPAYLIGWSDDNPNYNFYASPEEQSLVTTYRALDERGKDMVDTVLEKEYQHSNKASAPKRTYRIAAMGNADVRIDEDTAREIADAAENAPNLADKGFL